MASTTVQDEADVPRPPGQPGETVNEALTFNGACSDATCVPAGGGRPGCRRRHQNHSDQRVSGGSLHPRPHGLRGAPRVHREVSWIPPPPSPSRPSDGQLNVCCSYTYEDQEGVFPESQFVFDLELPVGFKPSVGDGEVQEFYLLPIDKVVQLCCDSYAFIIDFSKLYIFPN